MAEPQEFRTRMILQTIVDLGKLSIIYSLVSMSFPQPHQNLNADLNSGVCDFISVKDSRHMCIR